MSETGPSLEQLEAKDTFIGRHIGPSEPEVRAMLSALGVTSLEALIAQTIPASIRSQHPLNLPPPQTEDEILAYAASLASRNRVLQPMIGMGYAASFMPGVIRRNVFENPGWYTAYTPYQAEVSQGRMQALLNYQQAVMDLTAMPIANASLLDEATAAAEGMAMARRVSKVKSQRFFVDHHCHPQTLAVVETRARGLGIDLVTGATSEIGDHDVFGALFQYPDTYGEISDPSAAIKTLHANKAIAIVATDLLALTLLKPPGELGADIVVGSAQRFGVPLGYGGPHAAFFATREEFRRSMPGRIIGVSVDANGEPALRMALQTREQHIRREKATSNICTAQVLLAVIAGLFAVYHGARGIRVIAQRTHRLTQLFARGLQGGPARLVNRHTFDTVTIEVPARAAAIVERCEALGINIRSIDADRVAVAFDETTRRGHVETLWQAFGIDSASLDIAALDAELARQGPALPEALRRHSNFLEHPVFTHYHSETDMLRYLRQLQAKDIALDRAMIPLGSCTMKLNATTEMETVGLAGFSALHPYAPPRQAAGYAQLFDELSTDLCEITGYDTISLQPNAGSQGEYAGLLAIRAYQQSRGEGGRDVCLIPASAHGTNPASAVMAGLRVVVVACDDQGNVDLTDIKDKARQHSERLAALMVTYPSTHGVFETDIREICDTVHEHGGEVYMDGANLNAMVGLCRPGDIGADVSHLNLHKTFCIPHGGGGPGMGPIGVKAHLAPFLPAHPLDEDGVGAVSAAPYGSASILPISWAYIKLMGAKGLRRASEIAILNANYMASRLHEHFPVVYRGEEGRVAHECIIDFSAIKAACGITVEDVAKRLVDYGFHAPTMSWPVHDSLMIEPTESESKVEIDRFCDALISIRREIAAIENGRADRDDNVLKHAPHVYALLLSDSWERPYSREEAFFPGNVSREDKYWPPVGRVDNVYGDKNLVCSCPPLTAYLSDVA